MGNAISMRSKGDFKKTVKFLNFVSNNAYITKKLEQYGQRGVEALRSATPVDTGLTADSWDYQIVETQHGMKINWINHNIAGKTGIPVAMLIQYGHATRNGAWIQGIDYINPAIRPIFEDLADAVWTEVTNA